MLPIKMKLPDHFLDEEERCGFTVSPKMKKIWAVELDLLHEFQRCYKKYNLKYFTDSGTTIGAVRHNGFIPWDDDIDLAMFREDYKKLCQIAPQEFKHPYFFQTEESDPGSARGHGQIRNSLTTGILESERDLHYRFNQGIFIDIFVLDNTPDDRQVFNEQITECTLFREKANDCRFYTEHFLLLPRWNFIARAINFIKYKYYHSKFFFPHGYNKFLYEYEKCASKYVSDNTTKYITNLSLLPYKEHRTRLREDYSSAIEFTFEMLSLPVPIGYDRILTNVFGNWKVPQKEPSLHGGIFFDPEKSYTQYR